MAIKILELAKELNINSTLLLEKIKELKTGAKNKNSELDDEQANVVRKFIGKPATKIEKSEKPRTKKIEEEIEEPKVVVKAARKVTASPVKQFVEQTQPNNREKDSDKHVSRPNIEELLSRDKVTEKAKDEAKVQVSFKEVEPQVNIADTKPVEPMVKERHSEAEPLKKLEKESVKEEIAKEEEIYMPTEALPKVKILKKFDPEAERLEKEKRAAQRKQEQQVRESQKNVQKKDERRRTDNSDGVKVRSFDKNAKDDKFAKNRNKDSVKSSSGFDRGGFSKDKDEYAQEKRQSQSRDKVRDKKTSSADSPIVNKPQIKRDENKTKNKERNKFAKLEGGKPKPTKMRSLEKIQKPKKHQNRPKQMEEEIIEEVLPVGTKKIDVPITVAGFCEQLGISTSTVIMKLMKLGIMANINQSLDEASVLVLADELGAEVVIGNVKEEILEEGIENFEDREEDLKPCAPIVTVMGHVDHGKTSLLDAIRKTNVTARESGGITQHIGASEVTINNKKIVFLDTPGHEAFTAMRARGAHGADIAVLVVAADDSVKPQTVESISHAKAANVPIIVAINKIDKPAANIDKVKQDLAEHGILVEDWGGETICVPVSAKAGEGIVSLLEMVLLQAEMMELKANPDRLALGTVLEAKLDKARGPVASLLVTNGTLHAGMSVVAGTSYGRIKAMTDFAGNPIKKAGPSTAVEILGFTEVPQAGDVFNAVSQDKTARDIAEKRKEKLRAEVLAKNSGSTLEELFSQIEEGDVKELNLIVKGDVQGSVGALVTSFEKLATENVRVKIIHSAVGTVTESDIMLAQTSGAVIIGFNVRPSTAVSNMADREGVEIRTYSIIYDAIDDVEAAMKGMLDPEYKEEVLGKVEVRTTFKVPNVGTIAGAYVLEGKVIRNALIRLVRDGIVYHEGKVSSLKRFKDDVKEVMHGYECGIGFENYNDLKEGDVIECFHMVEIPRK
ncbi:MAG: translation initiation factor IF-2 [Eubacteriales bacterium]